MAAIMISVDDITMKTFLAIIEESIYGLNVMKPSIVRIKSGFRVLYPYDTKSFLISQILQPTLESRRSGMTAVLWGRHGPKLVI